MALKLIDSYSEANRDSETKLYNGSWIKTAQSFTAIGAKLTSCKLHLSKLGSPTGNAVAILYAHSGTFGTSSVPTGAALATSGNLDVATLTTSFQLITLTFTCAQQYGLLGGTKYCISLEYSGGNVSNALNGGRDDTSPTHAGNIANYASSWIAYSANDLCFYVYGDVVGCGFSGGQPWIF